MVDEKEIEIHNLVDKAIINSFEYADQILISKGERLSHGERILGADAIKKIIKKNFDIDERDTNIQKRIEILFEKGVLAESERSSPKEGKKSKKSKNRDYKLNNKIKIKFKGEQLLIKTHSVPVELLIRHTADLRRVIEHWIDQCPIPNNGYPASFKSADIINIEELELMELFSDLKNHLPILRPKLFENWENYKKEVETHFRMKIGLVELIQSVILEMFNGLHFRFVSSPEPCLEDYECNLLLKTLYDVVVDFSGRKEGQEAYDSYDVVVSWFEVNTKIIEYQGSIIWALKSGEELVQVPGGDRVLLEKGEANFIKMLHNIHKSELMKVGQANQEKREAILQIRDSIIRDLEELMPYHIYPGECKYLELPK